MLHTSYRFCHPHHPPRRTEPLPCTCSAPRTRPSTGIATAHQRPRLRPEARASGSSHPCLSFLSNCRTPTTSTLWQAFDLQHGTPARRGTRASATHRHGGAHGLVHLGVGSDWKTTTEDYEMFVSYENNSSRKTKRLTVRLFITSLPTLLARSCR